MLLHFFSILQNRVKTAFLPTNSCFLNCVPLHPVLLLYVIGLCICNLPLFLLDSLSLHPKHSILSFFFTFSWPPHPLILFPWLGCVFPHTRNGLSSFFFFSLMESYWYIKDQLCEFFSVFSKLELLLHPVSTTLCHPLFYLPLWHFNYMHISFPLGCELLEGGIISYSYLFLSVPNTVLKM